ncbi:MAG: hypothetical protein KGJ13_09820 [Patescibacteria group bacterium]|nr:hypothetical protein [Patescibacteria group bacterium]
MKNIPVSARVHLTPWEIQCKLSRIMLYIYYEYVYHNRDTQTALDGMVAINLIGDVATLHPRCHRTAPEIVSDVIREERKTR